MSNPSHILIARNSRGPNNPSAALSSPTETHAAASGIFRASGSPPWLLEECETDELVSELSIGDDDEAIELDHAFTRHSPFPGTVKIVVESTTFWAHKEVLYFASPFFEAALSGHWSETGRPGSMSSVITISQPPSVPGARSVPDAPTAMTFAPAPPDPDSDVDIAGSESEADDTTSDERARARGDTLEKLEEKGKGRDGDAEKEKEGEEGKGEKLYLRRTAKSAHATVKRRTKSNGPDAVIVLKEERASTFHDFLKFVYPHLECTITWNNVEGLMNIAHKLCHPALQRACLSFLLSHAAGRPIKALRIAELFGEDELFREASRFVLDNPGGWAEAELSTLSSETLLKLEKRRNWFLERVLKLGLTNIAKDYPCCSTCPDPPTCARLLEEKWRQAYNAVFRFGPCQPSMVYRYLRTLEGVSPPLLLTHLACQTTAKAFTATLFDRMFSLGVRGSGTDTAPLGARVAAVAGTSVGPRRHFLYCSLKNDAAPRGKRSGEL